jgi:drug/metabolite transporter (DMT)-like permease
MKAEQQGLLFLHIAVFLFGGTALFSQLIPMSALDITVYRGSVAAIFLFTLLVAQKKQLKLNSNKDYGIALLLGCLVGFHWVTYFAGMQMAGITIGIIAFFTYPVMTVFIEPLFNKSKPKLKDMISAVVVVIGIFLLVPEVNLGNQVTLGIITGISSAFLFSVRNILHKTYFNHYSGPHTMLYQALIASLMLCAFVDVPVVEVNQSDWLLIIVAGVVFTALPHALFASSLRSLSATTAGLISCLQPLYGGILAYLLLNERVSMLTLIGGALIISAAFFETWSVSKKTRSR